MKVQSLPGFEDNMAFISNFTQDEYIDVLNMTKGDGPINRIQILGQGKVLWFTSSKELLIFLMRYGS